MTKYLSLDCSTTAIGYSLWCEDELLEYGRLDAPDKKLDWYNRVELLACKLDALIKEKKPNMIIQEEVPKGGQGGVVALSRLYYAQGAYAIIEKLHNNIPVTYKEVGTWRKDIGISGGKGEDRKREAKKMASINKANELFNLGLEIAYTKSGNFKEDGTDDIADSILIYASTREKYKVKTGFGKKARV